MSPRQHRLLRVGALVGVVVALVVVGHFTGLASHVSLRRVRELVLASGPWGIAIFVALFSVGELIHVPGLVFVVAGVLTYGRLWGGLLGWVASLVAISVTFLLARAVAGKALADVESPRMKRLLSGLEKRPILTVFLLRTVFMMWPALSYAMALSTVRFRDYFVGSAAGLAISLAVVVTFFDAVMKLVS